jgi:sterol carrier protein 2
LKADGEALVNKVKGVFAFKVKDANGNEGVWIVDAKNGKGSVEFGGKGRLLLKVFSVTQQTVLFPLSNS